MKMPPMSDSTPAHSPAARAVALGALAFGALVATASLGGTGGCAADETTPPPVDMFPGTTGGPPATDDGSTTMLPSADSTTGDGSSTGAPVLNCADITCVGHGGCQLDDNGSAYCACDEGYVLGEDESSCVVDETCIKVRFLEDHCRQLYNAEPAVSLFFALDFCAGTAVTPEKIEEIGIDFVVLENEVDIIENVESDWTIVPTSVESYVTLVVDVSDSITQSKDLPALVAELRTLVSTLQPAAGGPDVYVSVYVFGRFVREYVPFTRDFAAVDGALAQIEDDPDSVVSLVNGDGTALYAAVAKGINRTQRIRELRDAVSWGGVLSTGTVVVITDGQDSSNATLDATQIKDTLNQVISIGISSDIDDEDLAAIGKDGSFLAPTPTDWTAAFAEVAQRVEEYPDRAYLLAYCSSANVGDPVVEVSVSAETKLVVEQTAACRFNADVFSSSPGFSCTQDLFTNECDTQACGGLTGCGACADDQCCNGTQCMAPGTINDVMGGICEDSSALCSAAGQICVDDACVVPDGIGAPCDVGCEPGVSWCDESGGAPGVCAAALPLGSPCDSAVECASQNCQPTNPENPFKGRTCQPAALLFDLCEGGGYVTCEEGGYCQGTTCAPDQLNTESCSNADQCRSGLCINPVQQNICVGSGVCYWPWNEKVPA